jgi:putative long chain acyl-CoA synthase
MDLPCVDLAVAYGVVPMGGALELAIVAVTLRGDRDLRPRDITAALENLSAEERPVIVHVVDELPVTTWYRPMTGPLRAAGVPSPGPGKLAWYQSGGQYRALTQAARRRLVQAASSAPES